MNSRTLLKYISAAFFFLAIYSVMVSQPPFQNPIVLNQKNGLPSNIVRDIVQDHQGFIWIATSNGLCRYDGSQMKIFDDVANDTSSLYTRSVVDIHVDEKTGNLWLSTNLGLHVYNPTSDSFKSYLPVAGDSSQLANIHIDYTFQDRQGQIWVGNFINGLALYRPETDDFEQIYPSTFFDIENENEAAWYNQVTGIVQDIRDDHIYWLINKKGLTRWDRKLGEMEVMPFPLEAKISKEQLTSVNTMYQHVDGTIFLGLWSSGFATWHPDTKRWLHFEHLVDKEGKVDYIRTVFSIVAKDSTCVYLTNNQNELLLYHLGQQKIIQRWKGSRKTKEQYALRLIDKDGNHWAGYNRGICIYNSLAQNMDLHTISTAGDDPEFLYRPNGTIFHPETNSLLSIYSKANGLYSFDLKTSEFELMLRQEDRPLLQYVQGIIQTGDQQIWVLSDSDLYVYLPAGKRLKKVRPTSEWKGAVFIQIRRDSRNDIWIGTYSNGIFRYDYKNKTWRQYQEEIETPTEVQHAIWLWGFTEDNQGKIWARAGTGYSVYLPDEDRFLNFPYKKGAKNNYLGINELCLDGVGVLWVLGGQQGAGLIDTRFPENGVFQQYGVDQGLNLNSAHEIIRDRNNDIWLADDERLSRFKAHEKRFEYFDEYYGVPAYDDELDMEPLNNCGLLSLPDGRMVLQYRRGLALFHPDSLKRNTRLPTPYLTSFQVNDQDYLLDSAITVKKHIKLKAKENDFSFEFSAINFSVPHLTRFRYRLLSEEQEKWTEVGERRYAAFTNVPGGKYILQVMAANSDGLWNDIPFELSIYVATPWYKTLLFQLGLIFLTTGIIFSIYKLRVGQIRRQQKQEAEFERKLANVEMNALRAQMNPHFIFNCLNSIDSYIIRNETRQASEYLNDFARLIRLILQNSRSNLINLKDELEALSLYLQMEQLRFRKKFEYEINIDPEVNQPATVVPPMLIQPYVENAVWHGLLHQNNGKSGKVVIGIKEENDCLIISIIDNGIGRKKAAEIKARKRTQSRKSMGTQITGDRIAMINHLYDTNASASTIDMEDDQGNALGTKIIIRIPI